MTSQPQPDAIDGQLGQFICQQTGDHYYASEHNKDMPIWIRRCMTCGFYDGKDMQKEIDALLASQVQVATDGLLSKMPEKYGKDKPYPENGIQYGEGFNFAIDTIKKLIKEE